LFATVDRLLLKTMTESPPRAHIQSGGRAACLCQRVEDNSFHLGTARAPLSEGSVLSVVCLPLPFHYSTI